MTHLSHPQGTSLNRDSEESLISWGRRGGAPQRRREGDRNSGLLSSTGLSKISKTSQTTYSADLCLDEPADGTALSGDVTVSSSITVTGTSPGVSKLVFFLRSEHLLTDHEAPYSFVLPTDTFVDGSNVLHVEAVMRDTVVTPLVSMTVDLVNGVTTTPDAATDFVVSQGTTPGPGEPFVVAATGDGASGQTSSDDLAASVFAMDPNLFLYLGDVYEDGTYTEFKNWHGDGFASALLLR